MGISETVLFYILVISFTRRNYGSGQSVTNKFENIIEQLKKPIRKLSEDFPDHDVQIQLEIDDNNLPVLPMPVQPLPLQMPIPIRMPMPMQMQRPLFMPLPPLPPFPPGLMATQRWVNYVHMKKPQQNKFRRSSGGEPRTTKTLKDLRRQKKDAETDDGTKNNTVIKTNEVSTKPTTKTTPQAGAATNSPIMSTDEREKPVHMEDLKQAFEEFEKKLYSFIETTKQPKESTTKPTVHTIETATNGCKSGHKTNENNSNNQQSNDKALITQNHNNNLSALNIISQLINNGLRVQKNTPKPSDNHMHWFQVKIPASV